MKIFKNLLKTPKYKVSKNLKIDLKGTYPKCWKPMKYNISALAF